jgi:hypothetical protein
MWSTEETFPMSGVERLSKLRIPSGEEGGATARNIYKALYRMMPKSAGSGENLPSGNADPCRST